MVVIVYENKCSYCYLMNLRLSCVLMAILYNKNHC